MSGATKLAKSDGKIGGTKAVIVKGRGTVDPNARCDMNPSVDIQAHYHVSVQTLPTWIPLSVH